MVASWRYVRIMCLVVRQLCLTRQPKGTKMSKATKVTEAAKVTETPKGDNTPKAAVFGPGKKEPRLGHGNMNDTKRSWTSLMEQIGEYGPQTVGEMQAFLKDKHNHMCFVKYAIKNKWLVEAAA